MNAKNPIPGYSVKNDLAATALLDAFNSVKNLDGIRSFADFNNKRLRIQGTRSALLFSVQRLYDLMRTRFSKHYEVTPDPFHRHLIKKVTLKRASHEGAEVRVSWTYGLNSMVVYFH